MILIDTCVWVEHLRIGDDTVAHLLEKAEVLVHPFVIGELAVGSIRNRKVILSDLQDLPFAPVATDKEVLFFIERHGLAGVGIGYVDAHLLAATQLQAGILLWTRDKRLESVASRLGVGKSFIH